MRANVWAMATVSVCALLSLEACYYDVEWDLYGPPVDCGQVEAGYSAVIEPMLSLNCKGCHSGTYPDGDLLLTTYEQHVAAAEISLERMKLPATSNDAMPPGAPLHPCNVEAFEQWILNGKLDD